VVVIGGGTAGIMTAKQLVKNGLHGSVTIVQAQPFMEGQIGMPYFITRPALYETSINAKNSWIMELEHVAVDGVNYAVGTVTAVEDSHVVLGDGGKLPYDALVIAVGVDYPMISASLGEDLAARKGSIKAFNAKVVAAKSILIGGGGPVALEMVGELRRLNADAKLSMVMSGSKPLEHWNGQGSAEVLGQLRRLQVELIVNERIEKAEWSIEPATYKTASGKEIQADIFLPYFGTCRTSFLASSVSGAVEKGRVVVNDKGQSRVKEGIFAVGCSSKYAALVMPVIELEAKVVAANIAALLNGQPLPSTLPDKPPGPPDVAWVHMGLGQYSVFNMAVIGPGPAACCRCCGCCNPCCPCCAPCGWCCMFPAGKLPALVSEKMMIDVLGGANKGHAAAPPKMATIERA